MARVPSPSIGGGRVGASDISVVQTRRQNIDFSPLARGLESQADDGGLIEGLDAAAQVTAEFAKQNQATEEETEFGALKLELRKRLFAIQNGDPESGTPGYRDVAGQNAVDGSADVIARIRAAEAEVTAKAQFERNKGRLATANGFSTLDALNGHSTYVNDARQQANNLVQGETILEATNAILGSHEPVKASTGNLIEIEAAARQLAVTAGAVPGTDQGDQIIEQAITNAKTVAITTVVNGLIGQDRVKEATALFTGYKNSINPKAWGGLMTALHTKGVETSAREIADEAFKAKTLAEGAAILNAVGNLEVQEMARQKYDIRRSQEKRIKTEYKADVADKMALCAEDPSCNLEDFSSEEKTVAATLLRTFAARDAQVKSGVPVESSRPLLDKLWKAYTLFSDPQGSPKEFLALNFSTEEMIRGLNSEDYKTWRGKHAAAFPTAENAARDVEKYKVENQDLAKFRSAIQGMFPGLSKTENANLSRYAAKTVSEMFNANPNRPPLEPTEWQEIASQGVAKGEHKDNWFQKMSLAEYVAKNRPPGFSLDMTDKEVTARLQNTREAVMKQFPGDTMSDANFLKFVNSITERGLPTTPATLLAEMKKVGFAPPDTSPIGKARAIIRERESAPARREATLKAAIEAEDAAIEAEDAGDAAQAQREAELQASVAATPDEVEAARIARLQAEADKAEISKEISIPGIVRDPVAEAEAARREAADEAEISKEIPINIPEPEPETESPENAGAAPEMESSIETGVIPLTTGETAPDIVKSELPRVEGVGDDVTGIPTGEGGIQLVRKAAYAKQLGRDLSDREAREMAVDEEHARLTSGLPGYAQLPANAQAVILDLAYNMGGAAVTKFPSLKKYVGAQQIGLAMMATLDTANVDGRTMIGIAKRRAEAYNTVIEGDKAIMTVQQLDDGTISYWFFDGTEIKYNTKLGKHSDSAPGEIRISF